MQVGRLALHCTLFASEVDLNTVQRCISLSLEGLHVARLIAMEAPKGDADEEMAEAGKPPPAAAKTPCWAARAEGKRASMSGMDPSSAVAATEEIKNMRKCVSLESRVGLAREKGIESKSGDG